MTWKKIEDRAVENIKKFLQKNRLINIKHYYQTILL